MERNMKNSHAILIAVCGLTLTTAITSWAQTYPVKPITIISSQPPGTGGDVAIRVTAPLVAAMLGQPFVVDTRPTAAGIPATQAAKRASSDGYTLLVSGAPFIFTYWVAKEPGFDPVKDFTAVTKLLSVPAVLAVSAGLPVNSIKDFIEYAKRNPGKLAYGSTGIGGYHHLVMESFMSDQGLQMLHVPYSNQTTTVTDLSTGRIHVFPPSYASLLPVLKSGGVRVLAVVDRSRLKALPDVPTVYEELQRHTLLPSFTGMVAPAGTSQAITTRLQNEFKTALFNPEVSAKLEGIGATPVGNTPTEWAAEIREGVENVGRIVKQQNIERQ
ncbi:MAG: tripartite tricarboxylate transporter substrate binding protein [Betaproteobacteria bacterium]|nr:tripartite tricarboxylate transporter substrate binding protein [Betaproteobacteria bacterium]